MIDYTNMTHDGSTAYAGTPLTRDEFIQECVGRSGGTAEQLLAYHDIVPCECGEYGCPGWRAVYLLENRRRARKAVGA